MALRRIVEQCRGEKVDARTDVYSVGIIAFEMLSGRLPFRSPNPVDVMHQHVFSPLPSLRAVNPIVEVPSAIQAVVRRALAKERDQRYPSAAEFARALCEADGAAGVGLWEGLRRWFGRGR